MPGTLRHCHRLREIAVQAMIQETAKVRAERAIHTRTLPPGQLEQYKPGDLVDFYRPPDSKDASGWIGPAKVIDPTHMERGTITIRHVHRPIEVRIGDLRRHMQFLVFLSAVHSACYTKCTSWMGVKLAVEAAAVKGRPALLIGYVQNPDGSWKPTKAFHTDQYRILFQNVKPFVQHIIRTKPKDWRIAAIRVGRGLSSVPQLGGHGYVDSYTIYWAQGDPHPHFIDPWVETGRRYEQRIGICNWRDFESDRWENITFLQVLWTDPEKSEGDTWKHNRYDRADRWPDHADYGKPDGKPQPTVPEGDNIIELQGPDSDLSTIPEGSDENSDTYFVHDDIDMQKALKIANECASFLSDDLPPQVESEGNIPSGSHYEFNASAGDMDEVRDISDVYHVQTANLRLDLPRDFEIEREEESLEIYYENNMHKILAVDPKSEGYQDLIKDMGGGLMCENVYRTSQHKNKANKKPVVDRPDQNLDPVAMRKHWPEVAAAMKKELKTWIDLGCIQRKLRSNARNVIDCRWVCKWKLDAETQAADSTGEAKKKWVIRARLCLRGFKDIDSASIDSYAGTAQRWSQRLVVSEAVLRKWDIGTTDISKAFLQGVTYEELAATTGEPLREVNFYLPGYAVEFIKQNKGWEDFDPRTEVINCIKPGTGCVDAPRCFSLKLAKVTRDICGLIPCTVDAEVCVKHTTDPSGIKKLACILAKHVDDIKITGYRETVVWVVKKIEEQFGQLKIDWNNFTNCGVRHRQDTTTKEVTLDQDEYIKGIKLCVHADISSVSSESKAGNDLHAQYWSVLGAIAYAVLTRPDIAVFVAALQRHSQSPCIIHVKRLNAVVRWAQRNPKSITYKQLGSSSLPSGATIPTHLREISDAAFKKEETTGHSMRGSCYLRCAGTTEADFVGQRPCHFLEWVARQQRRVTRATFTSELQGGCDTVDKGFLVLQCLDEMITGRISAKEALERREHGGWAVPAALYLDAQSVTAAVTATFVKVPADNGVLVHCLYLRELLDHNVRHALIWQDTRDMIADGLTKGAVERDALHAAMDGMAMVAHQDSCKFWRPKHLLKGAGLPPTKADA